MDKFVVKLDAKEEIEDDENDNMDNKKMMELELLRDYIEKKMSNNQKLQIINILKEGNTKYTKNKNGYFININDINYIKNKNNTYTHKDLIYKIDNKLSGINGDFINMNNVDNMTIHKLKLLVNFSKDNTKDIMKTEEKMNEEKNKMELIDKEETGGSSGGFLNLDDLEKNINFEIFTNDGVQSEIFDEFRDYNTDELEFMAREFLNDKRDDSGYRIILKRYKKKYLGNKAKILKKFRDIMKNSITNKSAKTTLIQATKKKTRAKPKKVKGKKEDTETGNVEDSVNLSEDEDDKEDDVEE